MCSSLFVKEKDPKVAAPILKDKALFIQYI